MHVGHDATLAALAETTCGPHKGARNLLYVTVSTGIGGGIVTDGRIVTGGRGGAGEVGYLIIRPGEEDVRARRPRHPGRQRFGHRHSENGRGDGGPRRGARFAGTGRRRPFRHRQPHGFRGRQIRLTPRPCRLVDHVIESIGIGMGGLINVFDPEALVLGGAVTVALGPEWARVRDAIVRHSSAEQG